MNRPDFSKFVNDTLDHIKGTLDIKGEEYTSIKEEDRFEAFLEIGKDEGLEPIQVLDILKGKHRFSEKLITRDFLETGEVPDRNTLKEKFGDQIVYLILKWAYLSEKFGA